jgi:hypothetical protein
VTGDVSLGAVTTVNIVSVPHDRYLSEEDIKKLTQAPALPTLVVDNEGPDPSGPLNCRTN